MPDPIENLERALGARYAVESELGRGGMATVYLAADLKHDRKVALKVLLPELAAVVGAERFLQEIKTTASLQHPHILSLFDSGDADAYLYYVLPYVEGETLRDKLNRETQLGIEEAVRITCEAADARTRRCETSTRIRSPSRPSATSAAAPAPLIVVENWIEEVKQRMQRR